MNKITIILLTALTLSSAHADVTLYRRGGCGFNSDILRVSYRHVPLSDPSEPYHDTYRKNRGEVNRTDAKPITNLHAKQSAAQADALRNAIRAEQARRPSISVYSNVTSRPTVSPARAAAPAASGERNITINNSNVVINNN